jgi:excisionase family DNA binding protein
MRETAHESINVTICGHSIKTICASLGVSKGFVNGQIKIGKLRARRLGRRVIVLDEDLRRYLEGASRDHIDIS